MHPSEIDWIKRNAAAFAKQQGNLTEEQAVTILTTQALYQVDLIWGLKLDGGGYQFNEAAQNFLAQAGDFAYRDNILGNYESQKMFTTTGDQRGRPGLYLDSSLADFYKQTILSGQFKLASTDEVVGYHLVQTGINLGNGLFGAWRSQRTVC